MINQLALTTAAGTGAIVSSIGVLAVSIANDPIEAASQIEKLGIIGILVVVLLVSITALIWITRFTVTKLMGALNENTAAISLQRETNIQVKVAMEKVQEHCARTIQR